MPELRMRVDEDLRKQIEDAAGAAGVSMNSEVVSRLKKSFDEGGKEGKKLSRQGLAQRDEEFVSRIVEVISEVNDLDASGHWSDSYAAYEILKAALSATLDIYSHRARQDERRWAGAELYKFKATIRKSGEVIAQHISASEVLRQSQEARARARKPLPDETVDYLEGLGEGILGPLLGSKPKSAKGRKAGKKS